MTFFPFFSVLVFSMEYSNNKLEIHIDVPLHCSVGIDGKQSKPLHFNILVETN